MRSSGHAQFVRQDWRVRAAVTTLATPGANDGVEDVPGVRHCQCQVSVTFGLQGNSKVSHLASITADV